MGSPTILEQPRSSISPGTVEGRSPGSWVSTFCSTFPVAQWSVLAESSPLTVAGAATASTPPRRLPCSLLILSDKCFEEPSTCSRCNAVGVLSIAVVAAPHPVTQRRLSNSLCASLLFMASGPPRPLILQSPLEHRSPLACYSASTFSGLSRLSEPSNSIALSLSAATARSIALVWSSRASTTRWTTAFPSSLSSPIIWS